MISLKKKFLFIHVPKTGGNSIQNVLRDYSEDRIVTLATHQDGVERFEVRNDKYQITKHSTLREYRSVIEPHIYESLYKFATIRNPWEMMISYYFSPHRGEVDWDRLKFIELINSIPTLSYFIKLFQPVEKNIVESMGSMDSYSLCHDLDFLIRFEHLQRDFDYVCEHLNINKIDLPHRNKSSRNHYSSYYDEELRELVRIKFINEIEYGHYEFIQKNNSNIFGKSHKYL